ncbi:hypothetical protein GGI42DRAFT_213498 [Trichoderma sp. SZMC 28013]
MRCCRRRVRGSKGGCTDSLHILCISQRRVTPVEAASLGLTTTVWIRRFPLLVTYWA